MTTGAGRAERRMTAFLGGPDSPDIRNPIHSTEYARSFGFAGALVGGATVYGWAVPAILEVVGDGWLEHGWAEIAFRGPVYPGQELTIQVDQGDGNTAELRITSDDGVCISGHVGLGDASWLGEIHVPSRRGIEHRHPEPVPLTLEHAPRGEEIGPLITPTTIEEMVEFAGRLQRSDDPRFVGPAPLVHPAWLASATTRLIFDQFAIPAGIDASRRIQHLSLPRAGESYTFYGYFADAYERKEHHYAVIEGSLVNESGVEVSRLQQHVIIRVARR